MIPIFYDAGREIQDSGDYEPSEFLEFVDGLIDDNMIEKDDPAYESFQFIKGKQETAFLNELQLQLVNDYILSGWGERPKNENGDLIPWNVFLYDH